MNIEPGQEYLLDGKTVVKVLKAINRSKTVYSIEIPGTRIDTVESDRLEEIKPMVDPK